MVIKDTRFNPDEGKIKKTPINNNDFIRDDSLGRIDDILSNTGLHTGLVDRPPAGTNKIYPAIQPRDGYKWMYRQDGTRVEVLIDDSFGGTQEDINIDMREDRRIIPKPDIGIYKSEFTIEEDIAFLKRQIRELPVAESAQFTFGVTTQGANGTVAITGIGFQPSMIKIRAWYQQDGKAGESNGIATTASNEIAYYRKYDGSNYTQDVADNVIILTFDNAGTVAIQATLDSIDADGFTMTFSQYIGSGSIKYQWEAYK